MKMTVFINILNERIKILKDLTAFNEKLNFKGSNLVGTNVRYFVQAPQNNYTNAKFVRCGLATVLMGSSWYCIMVSSI